MINTMDFKTLFKKPEDFTSRDGTVTKHKPYRPILRTDIKSIFSEKGIHDEFLEDREIVAQVFPFKVSQHTIDLINWSEYESDPIFLLTFPQPGMILPEEITFLKQLKSSGVTREVIADAISNIRETKNPAPSNQQSNRPKLLDNGDEEVCEGIQHKYKKTVLMFHKNAQTCHAYCTYCFRFNQFVGKDTFLENDATRLHRYLKQHPEITDVLMTGGDPATMKTFVFKEVLEPLLSPEFDHIKTIRIGTKALTYHPYRFLTEPDAAELIALFRKLRDHGKHIAIMAHFTHHQEISEATKQAARRLIEEGGATIRCQAPIMKHINDNSDVWATLWQKQVSLGMVPYYMFIARDTGPHRYFEVSLAKALRIYQEARKKVSGLGHTARGPSMSASPGKIMILGRETISGEDVFILKFLQGRNDDWTDRVFFAKYSETASWLDDLEPAFGETEFFFEKEYNNKASSPSKNIEMSIA
jgi:KamA family protein